MECLDDRDESIRLRALDLISGMVRLLLLTCSALKGSNYYMTRFQRRHYQI